MKVGSVVKCIRGSKKGHSGKVLVVSRRRDRSGALIKVVQVEGVEGVKAVRGREGENGGLKAFNPFLPACCFKVLD